eukprot:GHRR01027875.1.p1 GENE.GHRR01027875.1~~GHRR01027875.1.p1  ORF type:complete len:110 (-),score=16.42 GHRR01027875.1:196-525(-)
MNGCQGKPTVTVATISYISINGQDRKGIASCTWAHYRRYYHKMPYKTAGALAVFLYKCVLQLLLTKCCLMYAGVAGHACRELQVNCAASARRSPVTPTLPASELSLPAH